MEVEVPPEVGSLYGRYVAARAGFSLQRLVHQDEIWTSELEMAAERGVLGPADMDGLERLVAEMEASLREVQSQVRDLRPMLNDVKDDEVDEAFALILATKGGPEQMGVVREQLGDYELRGAAIAGCDYVMEKADEEALLLREKLSRIVEQGEVPPGDLRAPFRCAALIALVGAGTVSMIGLGGPVGLVAMGAVSQVGLGALAWMQENCTTQIHEITFGRRG